MSEFINPYSLSFIAGFVSVIISYIDSKRNRYNRQLHDYLKLCMLVSIITLVVIYIYDTMGGTNIFDKQEILTGNPTF